MGLILAIATILGGIAAIWYFIDKVRRPQQPMTVPTTTTRTEPEIERVILDADPRSEWSRKSTDSKSVTVFKRDVNLRFEMSHTPDGIQCDDFKEEWANRHPDPHATGYFCDLYYGSSLIRRFVLVSVDGGRALLPLPESRESLSVSPIYYRVAEIHDSIGTLAGYMARSGLAVDNG